MARKVEGMTLVIKLSKNGTGEVQVEATAHVEMGTSEYSDMKVRKGIPLNLTASQEAAVISFAKNILAKIMADENAQDGIPSATPEPE